MSTNTKTANRIPNAVARVIVVHERRQDVYLLQVDKCPLCGKAHTHGAGTNPDEISSFLGHRNTDCDIPTKNNHGYNLVLAQRKEGAK